MIQVTLIQIDNYGPWTVTPEPKTESDLQMLQSELFADIQSQFAAKKGLVFFNRFDNMIAISNNLTIEDHKKIQESISNRYPITISMGIGADITSYGAQKKASEALQKIGGAQSPDRKEIIAVDSLNDNDSIIQVAHIDIDGITASLTDTTSAYDTSVLVTDVYFNLMKKFLNKKSIIFFIGGDNFMAVCNEMSTNEITEILKEIKEELNVDLKAGIGKSFSIEKAAKLSDIGLELIRNGESDLIHYIEE